MEIADGNFLNSQTSLMEDLIAKWWNWWHTIPQAKAAIWPHPKHGCLIGNGGDIMNDQSVIFLANPSFASESNLNRGDQKCQILDNQAIFFPLYNSVCDTSMPKFRVVNYPLMLDCARDANSNVETHALINNKEVEEKNKLTHYTEKTFDLVYPEQNPYLDPPGSYVAVGGGVYLFMSNFSPGEILISYGYHRDIAKGQSESGEVKYTISVVESTGKRS